VTGFIISAEYNPQTPLTVIQMMVMADRMTAAIHYARFLIPFAAKAVKTTQHYSWRYQEIASIYSAERDFDPPGGYISEVNEFSHQLFSSLTFCIRLLPRLLAHQW
jgi:hypothetical protein